MAARRPLRFFFRYEKSRKPHSYKNAVCGIFQSYHIIPNG